jgi:hypothetical protein
VAVSLWTSLQTVKLQTVISGHENYLKMYV